jgi:hypothetical protein
MNFVQYFVIYSFQLLLMPFQTCYLVLMDFSETEKKEMTGLGIGVASMKAGERALLRVSWELGYGKEGSFSFPNVPPMADLVYEVELIGFDETKDVSWH